MSIKKPVNPLDYEVGVVIGRFQTNDLHIGHTYIIDEAFKNHKKVIILVGISRITSTKKNPLDFATREKMLKEAYPDAIILPLRDQRFNEKWSQEVDSVVSAPYGNKKTVIYGGKDSFIPYYSGKFPTIELETIEGFDATNTRQNAAYETLDSSDFRSGCIYQSFNLRPTAYPTVDITVFNEEGEILLGRKPQETLFRFIGGFVDPADKSLEIAAARELHEEAGISLTIGTPVYMMSQSVEDWRYAKEESGIITSLFLAPKMWGRAEAGDDIAEVKWVKVQDLSNFDYLQAKIVPEHLELMKKFITKVYKEDLIPNIGEPKFNVDELINKA